MKERIKGLLMGVSLCALFAFVAIPAIATTEKNMTLHYNNIQITLDGKPINPQDANGRAVEPFVMDGSTYLPVRGIAEALGLGVEWDQAAQTVRLSTDKPAEKGAEPAGEVPKQTLTDKDIQLTVDGPIVWKTIDHTRSTHYGKEAFGIQITIRNNRNESFYYSRFRIDSFNPDGVSVRIESFVELENRLDASGVTLRPNAEYTGYLYFIYEGDGTYYAEYDDWDVKFDLAFDITR